MPKPVRQFCRVMSLVLGIAAVVLFILGVWSAGIPRDHYLGTGGVILGTAFIMFLFSVDWENL